MRNVECLFLFHTLMHLKHLEQRGMGGQVEIRNSKQYQMTKILMTKTLVFTSPMYNWHFVPVLNIEKFEFRICFVFRASDFGFNITQKAPEKV